MSRSTRLAVLSLTFTALAAASAFAQAPANPLAAQAPIPTPATVWSRTASAGLALTSGNKDTSTINAGFEVIYNPKSPNLVRADGLFLRGKTDGTLTADRLQLNGRDEYRFAPHAFAFGQVQYLQDQFKNIDYLIAPTAGLGYSPIDNERTKLSFDAGLGGVWEKRPSEDVQASGAVVWSEKLVRKISTVATLTQGLTALYRTDDFGNALYTFNTVLAASVTTHAQLKVELLDIYKTQVIPGIEKNDVAVIVGLVFKF